MSDFFTFVEVDTGEKTGRYDLVSKKGELLGSIKYFPYWRQYCFFPDNETIWSAGCLKDVVAFLDKINSNGRD